MLPVKHTVIYTFFAITSVQNTCFCSVFNALASKNPAKSCYVQCFGKKHIFSPPKKIFTNPAVMYVNSPVLLCSSYSTPPLAPLTDRNKPAVWAATPREAGWIARQRRLDSPPNPVFFECVSMFLQWFPSKHGTLHFCRHKTGRTHHVRQCCQLGPPKLSNFPPRIGFPGENFHFSPPGASQAKNFHFPPPVGAPQAREFSLFPPVGAPQFSPPWQLPKLWNFHFSLPWRLSKLRNVK